MNCFVPNTDPVLVFEYFWPEVVTCLCAEFKATFQKVLRPVINEQLMVEQKFCANLNARIFSRIISYFHCFLTASFFNFTTTGNFVDISSESSFSTTTDEFAIPVV